MPPHLRDLLASRPYPGRVCVAGRTADGTPFAAYALTGRSAASRARTLVELPGGDVEVRDTSGGEPDSLRHYVAVAHRGPWLVVGNGDHVPGLADDLAQDIDPRVAGARHTFEPDPPIHTPRIWLASRKGSEATLLGWVRRGRNGRPRHGASAIAGFEPGHGALLSTYEGTASDVRTTTGPAAHVLVTAPDARQLRQELWSGLAPTLRVAALVRTPDDLSPLGANLHTVDGRDDH